MKISYVGKMFLVVVAFMMLLTSNSLAQTAPPASYGAKGALQDTSITLGEALTYAIQDEYLAQARYDAIIGKFGAIRPFTQIKAAEQRHIQALLPLFQRYNIALPANTASQYTQAPATLKEAFQAGVQAEIDNIAMYEKFVAIPGLPQDVKTVFSNVGGASRNHLAAFQAGLSRTP